MAGHSAFENNLIKHVALGNTAIKKIALGNDIVWSGASLVSYYDGTTLLGTEEVDEGEDVLRPSSITPSKTNYTHVGWATSNGGSRVTELVATGEPMSLYALWLPNSLVVANVTDEGVVTANADYVTGTLILTGSGTPYLTGSVSWNLTDTFSLNMGLYRNNAVVAKTRGLYSGIDSGSVPYISASTLDNVNVPRNNTKTFTDIAEGNHTLHIVGRTTQESTAVNSQTHILIVSTITLSNPTPWQ